MAQGPNRGIWYVSDAYYFMDRGSAMNPSVTVNGPDSVTLQNGGDRSACRNNGIPAPYEVNFFTFNEVCKQASLSAMFAGVFAHEGLGTGQDNGHEIRRRNFASTPSGDPTRTIEPRVFADSVALVTNLRDAVGVMELSISSESDPGHSFVKNNWCGDAWVWHTSNSRFLLIDLWLDAQTQTCF